MNMIAVNHEHTLTIYHWTSYEVSIFDLLVLAGCYVKILNSFFYRLWAFSPTAFYQVARLV